MKEFGYGECDVVGGDSACVSLRCSRKQNIRL